MTYLVKVKMTVTSVSAVQFNNNNIAYIQKCAKGLVRSGP